MLKFNCFVTGDDYAMLMDETPESRKKVSALASVVLIPVIIWFANGFLMISTVLEGSILTAVMVGFFLSFLIFLIERNIIMAQSTSAIKTFRITLGVIIAMLGAVCLDEAIFKEDVDQKLVELNQLEIDNSLKLVEKDYSSEMNRAQSEVDKKYESWQTAMQEAKNEADGTSGSGIKGVHAITRVKLANADVCKVDYENALQSFNALVDKIDREKLERAKRISEGQSNHALLGRIKALFHLVFSDWAMGIIYGLFTLFLFFMEFLVVFMKNAWPKTNYERRLDMIEEIGRKRMERLMQKDITYYEPVKNHPRYKNTLELLKSSSSSLYN